MLVATTIIESGIDNPHTNTLIIEDSERLGLAQLYQLKGRVGRSHVKAYAYFLFGRGKQLTEQAAERLTAIAELTELGSGIKVAMRDLEIRGAGSLLGAEQHGNMSAVGFDLYAQMLREAVAEARGEPEMALPDIRIDVPVKAFLPEEYVPAADERVRFYRRLAAAGTSDTVEGIVADLVERHGAMPEVAANLAGVARARALAGVLGATNVAVVRNQRRRAAGLARSGAARRARGTGRGLPREGAEDPATARLWRTRDERRAGHADCYNRRHCELLTTSRLQGASMTRLSRPTTLVAVALLALVALTAAGCAKSAASADAIARVNGTDILKTTIDKQIAQMKKASPATFESTQGVQIEQQYRAQILNGLIDLQLVREAGKSVGVTVTTKQIDDYVAGLEQQYGSKAALETAMKTAGFDMATLRDQINNSLLMEGVSSKVASGSAAPTDAQIKTYYDANKSTFATPAQVHAEHILLADEGQDAGADRARPGQGRRRLRGARQAVLDRPRQQGQRWRSGMGGSFGLRARVR